MNILSKLITITVAIIAMTNMLTGCGEEGGMNVPDIKFTSSAIVSEIADGHGHNVVIPFTDVSSAPSADTFQYRSSDNTGHSHVIALSKQQIIDLNNGMQLTVTSSTPNSDTAHTHIWKLLGGNVLYDKYCYNCHSNDKRGHNPMNVSFNNIQSNAVKSPDIAPVSASVAPIPDTTYAPSTTVLLDGPALYASNCESCHNLLASSTKVNKTFTQIKSAITNNSGGMSSLGALTDAQLQVIESALKK